MHHTNTAAKLELRRTKHESQWIDDLRIAFEPKAVLRMLDRYDGTDGCFPKVESLVYALGCSRRTIFRALDYLEQIGLITRHKRRPSQQQWSTHYTIHYEVRWTEPDAPWTGRQERATSPRETQAECQPDTHQSASVAPTKVSAWHSQEETSEEASEEVEVLEASTSSTSSSSTEDMYVYTREEASAGTSSADQPWVLEEEPGGLFSNGPSALLAEPGARPLSPASPPTRSEVQSEEPVYLIQGGTVCLTERGRALDGAVHFQEAVKALTAGGWSPQSVMLFLKRASDDFPQKARELYDLAVGECGPIPVES